MNEIIRAIEEHKIIVIVRGVPRKDLLPMAEAMYEGGIRLIECTYDAKGLIPDEEIAGNIALLGEAFAGRLTVGAGTVMTEKQAELTARAGGKFVISPDTNADIIRKTKELGLVSIPGAMTPTEIAAAHRAGADFVKLFPIDLCGGVKYLKTISAPLSHVRILAVNGITAENMSEFLAAGAKGVGVGSGIVNKEKIAAGDFAAITALARRYTEQL